MPGRTVKHGKSAVESRIRLRTRVATASARAVKPPAADRFHPAKKDDHLSKCSKMHFPGIYSCTLYLNR